ncbi:LINE-1 type transposase domain containing protein 1 [Dissostichus eleginoides]|uniref:LINE-1 type transposase domain containing protein 1 n=1 Tax=Dissostichus eleginoides TaxID=100907 RepID=A0AAD9ER76_DISEL|nr:LINE-1 type transposase domain containing protein 1 [Dissostichus eleginoides]
MQNLRVAGVKEGKENGQRTRLFVAELLKETLGLEKAPEIDRAHRALRRRAGDNEPPRHLIARIFRDLPTEVVKRRAAFTPTKRVLRDKPGVRFGLLYPAKLRVSHNGSERFFTDPEEARQYAERIFGSAEEE